MKITTYKGYDTKNLHKHIASIMASLEADSLGNITLICDIYKDGKKVEEKEVFEIIPEQKEL